MAETPAFHSGLTVDASPHIKAPDTTAEIMKTVSVALLPCLFASVFYFGAYALFVVAGLIASCIFSLPSGPTIVVISGVAYVAALGIKRLRTK